MNSGILTLVVVLGFVPVLATAHSDITDEREAGDYRVVMSYFGDAAFEDDPVGFNIFVYPKPEGDLITPEEGSVRITKQEGSEVFSGNLDVADADAPGFIRYAFADGGDYILEFALTVRGEKLPVVSFPVFVYTVSEPAAVATTTATVPTNQNFSERSKQVVSIGALILLVVGGLAYVLKQQADT
jgi:hypothetical protein